MSADEDALVMHGVRASQLALGLLFLGLFQSLTTPHVRALSPDPLGSSDPRAPVTSGEEAPPGYEAAADLGFEEFESGHYEEARARFLEAQRLWPNARILRALGYCEFELEHYVAAVEFLESALARAPAGTLRPATDPAKEQTSAARGRPLSETQRRETEALLVRARAHVARVKVPTIPREARVLIDGVETKPDVSGAVLLAAGRHSLEVQAAGYQVARRELEIVGTVDRVVQVALSPVAQRAPNAPSDVPLRRKWWLWTGVATVAAASVATALAVSLHDPGERRPDDGSTNMVIPVGRSSGLAP